MTNIYCITESNSLARRVGDNEWYIDRGGWGFNILTDDTVGIVNLPVTNKNTIQMSVYVFAADNETIETFGSFADSTEFKTKCPQLDWSALPPYIAPICDSDDDVAF